MLSFSILIFILTISFVIFYKLVYWIIILWLAIINSFAVYDGTSKKAILQLSKKDKVWKDVAKILELKEIK